MNIQTEIHMTRIIQVHVSHKVAQLIINSFPSNVFKWLYIGGHILEWPTLHAKSYKSAPSRKWKRWEKSNIFLKTILISSSSSVSKLSSVSPCSVPKNSRYESLNELSEKHVRPLCSHWHSRFLHIHLIDSEWWFITLPKSCDGFSWTCSLVGHNLIQNEFRWLKLEQCHSVGTFSHLLRF